MESTATLLIDRMAKNIQQEKPNPVEQARRLRRLIDKTGRTQKEIASLTKISTSQVCRLLSLLSLDENTLDKVESGEIGLYQACEMVRKLDEEKSGRWRALRVRTTRMAGKVEIDRIEFQITVKANEPWICDKDMLAALKFWLKQQEAAGRERRRRLREAG